MKFKTSKKGEMEMEHITTNFSWNSLHNGWFDNLYFQVIVICKNQKNNLN